MTVVKELDRVVLQNDLPEHGLVKGGLGAVVHVYDEGAGFEVEFVDADGRTVAVETPEPRSHCSGRPKDSPRPPARPSLTAISPDRRLLGWRTHESEVPLA